MSLADEKKEKNTEEKVEKVIEMPKKQPVVDGDIDLSMTRKKVFRINGDNSKLIELNPSDMGILTRLTEAYPKLQKLEERAVKMTADVSSDGDFDEVKLGKELKSVDKDMRKIIDTVFDANVSEVCAPDGTMFDMFNGKCRYEYIINAIINLYDENISKETQNLKDGTQKYTAKYSNKRK